MYAAFFLLLTLLGVAALFVLASADLLAVAQIMIYVGGVLVLVIFGVMLTHKPRQLEKQKPNVPRRNYVFNATPVLAMAINRGCWVIYGILQPAFPNPFLAL